MPGMPPLLANNSHVSSPAPEAVAAGDGVQARPRAAAPTPPAQLAQVGRELREVVALMKASSSGSAAYLKAILEGKRLMLLRGALTVPAEHAATFKKRYDALQACLDAPNAGLDALGIADKVVAEPRAKRFGAAAPSATKLAPPERNGAPSRRETRRLAEGLERSGLRANAATKKAEREADRAAKQSAASQAREAAVADRLQRRSTAAMDRAEMAARAELAQIEATMGAAAVATPGRRL